MRNKIFFSTLLSLTIFGITILLDSCANSTGAKANIYMHSAQYLNPDIDGKPSPIVVSIYALKTPFQFNQATYNQLDNNAAAILNTNLIDRQSIELRPATQRKTIQMITPNTHYLGITAAYRNIDIANWRNVIKVPKKQRNINIFINLESQGLIAKIIK